MVAVLSGELLCTMADGGDVPAGGANDIATLLQRIASATEAAVTAANAAVGATQLVAATGGSGGAQSSTNESKDWYRMLPRPGKFAPQTRDEAYQQFRDWFWSVEQYLGAIDPGFVEDLAYIRNHLIATFTMGTLSEKAKARSTFVYGLLSSLVKNRPLLIIRGIGSSNGYEAVRCLIQTCQPPDRNRSLALMNSLMTWPGFDMKQSLLGQILKFEEAVREYERIATELPESMKTAILARSVGGQLRTYLSVQLSDETSYGALRDMILRYDQATTRWDHSMSSNPANFITDMDNQGLASMEVDKEGQEGQTRQEPVSATEPRKRLWRLSERAELEPGAEFSVWKRQRAVCEEPAAEGQRQRQIRQQRLRLPAAGQRFHSAAQRWSDLLCVRQTRSPCEAMLATTEHQASHRAHQGNNISQRHQCVRAKLHGTSQQRKQFKCKHNRKQSSESYSADTADFCFG